MSTPSPAYVSAPSSLTAPVGVEIGLFDETDTPEEPHTVPLSRYLEELSEFMRLDMSRCDNIA